MFIKWRNEQALNEITEHTNDLAIIQLMKLGIVSCWEKFIQALNL